MAITTFLGSTKFIGEIEPRRLVRIASAGIVQLVVLRYDVLDLREDINALTSALKDCSFL